MPSPEFQIIHQAIQQREQIVATYHGSVREMCPHTLGYKDGQEKALFVQFGGGSSSGLSPDPAQQWRCVFVAELSNVIVRSGPWHTAPNHGQEQTCIDEVVAEAI
jgi:hypothetical protein